MSRMLAALIFITATFARSCSNPQDLAPAVPDFFRSKRAPCFLLNLAPISCPPKHNPDEFIFGARRPSISTCHARLDGLEHKRALRHGAPPPVEQGDAWNRRLRLRSTNEHFTSSMCMQSSQAADEAIEPKSLLPHLKEIIKLGDLVKVLQPLVDDLNARSSTGARVLSGKECSTAMNHLCRLLEKGSSLEKKAGYSQLQTLAGISVMLSSQDAFSFPCLVHASVSLAFLATPKHAPGHTPVFTRRTHKFTATRTHAC
jgi:hypothetical protein